MVAREDHDHRVLPRCPMLGQEIPFSYCRRPGRELPCGKILDCWFEVFDVVSFIRACYRPEEIERFLTPAQPKLQRIVELIARSRGTGTGSK